MTFGLKFFHVLCELGEELAIREGGGRGVQDGEHMYTHDWFMSMYGKTTLQYCKVISLQLNKLKKNKKIFMTQIITILWSLT